MAEGHPTRDLLEQQQERVLNKGRFANARVRLCRAGGALWVVKDYAPKAWVVRQTTGRFFLRREFEALDRLRGIPGVPQDPVRIDRHAIAFRFMPGCVLHKAGAGRFSDEFFPRLESIVRAMHERGVAHLDLRYRHNVLMLDDGTPGVIDFQSFVKLDGLPGWLREHFKRVDLSGVYKHWAKWKPGTLGPEREALLARENRLRKLWIFRGYGGKAMKRKKES